MASNPTLTQVVVEMIGAAIKFPQQINATSFLPNAISINNRSASTIQVGPGVSGPFILMGQFTLAQLPWTYGRSVWVQEVGGPAAHIATEFVQVTFLGVSPASAIGAGNITSYAPSGWGSVGPGNSLANINAGDPFNFGQVQQFVNLLTGVMTGQIVQVSNTIETIGASGQFASMDQDGVGGDFFSWFVNLGLWRLVSSVGGTVLTVGESGSLSAATLQASQAVNPSLSIQNPGVRNYFFVVDGSNNLQCQELIGGANIFQIATNIFQMRAPFYPSTDANAAQSTTALHAGTGAPSNANGNNNDFYFRGDGAAGTFIYHKAAGTWTAFV